MTSVRKKTVLIADDHALLAAGIAGLLAGEYEVVGLASNGRHLIADAFRLNPNLIVLDVSMPEMNGIEAASRLQQTVPEAKLIFVTQQIDPHYLRAAFRAGASAYVAKQSASEELLLALREASAGRTFITPLLREAIGFVPASELRKAVKNSGDSLTTRQREILQLIAEGKTAREISTVLSISTKTVEFHKKALMDSTGLRTIAELTRYAITNGFVAL